MTAKPESPPAFPSSVPVNFQYAHDGMSLRDWFAGQALQGMQASAAYEITPYKQRALEAYELADAMLAERSKTDDR